MSDFAPSDTVWDTAPSFAMEDFEVANERDEDDFIMGNIDDSHNIVDDMDDDLLMLVAEDEDEDEEIDELHGLGPFDSTATGNNTATMTLNTSNNLPSVREEPSYHNDDDDDVMEHIPSVSDNDNSLHSRNHSHHQRFEDTYGNHSQSQFQFHRSPPPRVVSSNSAMGLAVSGLQPPLVSPDQGSASVHSGFEDTVTRGVRKTHSMPSQMTELQRQYQQTLKKLARSMRQSDVTRRIVQRQRSSDEAAKFVPNLSSSGHSVGSEGGRQDFFLSDRCKELEEDRKQLFRMINY